MLTPAAADYTIDKAIQMIAERRQEGADVPGRLDAEARRLRKEIERFVRAIAGGTAPASVLAEIQSREARLTEIGQERQAFAVEGPTELEGAGCERRSGSS